MTQLALTADDLDSWSDSHPYPWMLRARCRDTDEPIAEVTTITEAAPLVERFCSRCPVRGACRDYAIAGGITVGLFGGLTPNQRTRYRKRSVHGPAGHEGDSR